MIKVFIVLLALGTVGWYYFIGGRRLDETMVRAFYVSQVQATLARDPEAQCKLLGKSLALRQETLMAGQTKADAMNHDRACASIRKPHEFFEAAGEKAGGMLTIEYDYELGKIEIAADRKSARVELTSTLKMGEAFMQFRNASTERVERRLGQLELVESDVKTRVSWTPGALADPSKYFESR